MRRALTNDVVKIFCYVAGVLLLGALIAPWLYNGGKALFEVAGTKTGFAPTKETNSLIRGLADACGRSEFPRFFDRSIMLAALVLFLPLVRWLKMGRGPLRYRDTPWSFHLPEDAIAGNEGQPLRRNPYGWIHLAIGFFLAAGGLLLLGYVLIWMGAFMPVDAAFSVKGVPNLFPVQPMNLWKAARSAIGTATFVSIAEEIVFRGILLGIFLRAMRPASAIVSLSLLFAFLHYMEPKTGVKVPDPESATAGFWLLGQIAARYAEPLSLLAGFCTLTAVGIALAHARWRTASLWLPIGLHAGWIFGIFVFKDIARPVANLGGVSRYLIGGTMREGLLPLAVVALTGLIVHLITRNDVRDPSK